MKRNILIVSALLVIGLVAAFAWSRVSAANNGLTRTEWPSAEDPGPPFYARTEHAPPFVFHDGEWAAIVFYRDPGCVPAGFNLVQFFDPPAAFGCQLTTQGVSHWEVEVLSGAPKITNTKAAGEVPVWFVPVQAITQATQDGVLTMGELEGLDGLLVGFADRYTETLQPHSLPPELGGGGHPNPKLVIDAQGSLEDGRQFNLHITQVQDELKAIRIQFR